jgi:soluble lytic murein transglycosylase
LQAIDYLIIMTIHSKHIVLPATIIFFLMTLSTTFSFSGIIIEEDDTDKAVIVSKTVQYLKGKNISATDEKLKTIANSVYEESQKYAIDYRLVLAVMKIESNFKNEAISRKGARGLLQVKPSLARYIAKDTGIHVEGATSSLHEPEKNIKIGVNYLSKLLDMFEDLASALHAYNAGPSKVKKTSAANTVPSTPFTKKVLNEYKQIIEVLPDPEED